MRRGSPQPPAEIDAVWERVGAHLVAITRTLQNTAGADARLTSPSYAYLARWADLAENAAAVCNAEADLLEGAGPSQPLRDQRHAALERARIVHEELTTEFQREQGAAIAVGGELVVETQQLLRELADIN